MYCIHWFLHAQMMGTLQDSFACFVFPAPRAFPTHTLAATENPSGNCVRKLHENIEYIILDDETNTSTKGIVRDFSNCVYWRALDEKNNTERMRQQPMRSHKRSYHVSCDAELVHYGLSQESSYFKNPPWQTNYEHAGNGQFDKETPLLKTIQWPTCGSEVCSWTVLSRFSKNYSKRWKRMNMLGSKSPQHQEKNRPPHVALCRPLQKMWTCKIKTSKYCEIALAAADPL